jgi:MtN3 and saliva related transmembrane protein
MTFAEIIGFVAATLTTLSFYPQAYKIIKTRDTASISLVMYSIINVGLILWLVYGLMIGDMPIILANAFTLIASLTILFLKIKR